MVGAIDRRQNRQIYYIFRPPLKALIFAHNLSLDFEVEFK
jgi:hypothetical protein